MSLGKLCDAGCHATFDKTTCQIYYKQKLILQGLRSDNMSRLWTIDIASKPLHTVNATIENPTVADIVRFLHATMGSPPLIMLQQAIDMGYLATFPAFTSTQLRKYALFAKATVLGHLKAKRSNLRSTKQNAVTNVVDDLRPTGPSREEAWQAARRAASILNHLGIQDAPRKRHDSSQSSGAWTGSVVKTGAKGTFVLTSQEKWDKARSLVKEILTMLEQNPNALNRKRLEQIRGCLQYVTQTYTSLTSYLIGLHMTIDSWRSGRDAEGWRMPLVSWRNLDKAEEEDWGGAEDTTPTEAPNCVKAVPRLSHDMSVLLRLMGSEKNR
jgi:hypothetical protein